jgi:hypothetical protein
MGLENSANCQVLKSFLQVKKVRRRGRLENSAICQVLKSFLQVKKVIRRGRLENSTICQAIQVKVCTFQGNMAITAIRQTMAFSYMLN